MNTDDIRGADGHTWPQTMDAQAWVTPWMRLTEDKPEVARDPGTMIGWFANAIMAGFDEAQRRAQVAGDQTMSPSEAVVGFAAWLTSRQKAITISTRHNAANSTARRRFLSVLRLSWRLIAISVIYVGCVLLSEWPLVQPWLRSDELVEQSWYPSCASVLTGPNPAVVGRWGSHKHTTTYMRCLGADGELTWVPIIGQEL